MQPLLGLLLALVAATASVSAYSAGHFFDGVETNSDAELKTELEYKYENQITTGLLPHTRMNNGRKLTLMARVQFFEHRKVRVEFSDISFFSIDQPIVTMNAQTHMLPNEILMNKMEKLDYSVIKHHLSTPFSFRLSNGIIDDVAFEEGDITVEIKKAFINLFQVNLGDKVLKPDAFEKVNADDKSYRHTLFEKSPIGDCATDYFVNTLNDESITVTKVKDLNECMDTPIFKLSPYLHGADMSKKLKANPLSRSAKVSYDLKGNKDKFVITAAVAEDIINFDPYKDPSQPEEICTTVNQTLTLVREKPVTADTEIPVVRAKCSQHSLLRMEDQSQPSNLDAFRQEKDKVLKMSKQSCLMSTEFYSTDKIISTLRLAADNMATITSQESMVYLRILNSMLRITKFSNIKIIYETLKTSQDKLDNQARELLWRTLPHVGTDDAAMFILDVCMEDEFQCSWALNTLPLTLTPSEDTINKLIELIKSNKNPSPLMKQKTYLTLGTFAFKLTQAKNTEMTRLNFVVSTLKKQLELTLEPLTSQITERINNAKSIKAEIEKKTKEIDNKILKTLLSLLESSESTDKILALKAIANSGLTKALPELKKILEDETLKKDSTFLRIFTILAHRRFGHSTNMDNKQDTINMLLKIFHDTTETNEIRNVAFVVLVSLDLDLNLLTEIAASMHHEKDLHVSSFVLSTLQTFANSTYLPTQDVTQKFIDAMKSTPRYTTGSEHSSMNFGGIYNDANYMGASLRTASLGSMDRFMGLTLSLETVMFGVATKPLEFGVNTMGLNTLINKLTGTKALSLFTTSFSKMFFDDKSEDPAPTPKEFIDNLVKILNIKPREFHEAMGHLYVSFFGNEVRYFENFDAFIKLLTPETQPFNTLFQGLQLSLPVDVTTSLQLMALKMSLPTDAGIPVALHANLAAMLTLAGRVHTTIDTPSNLKMPKNIKVNVDLDSRVLLALHATMGGDWVYLKRSVGLHALVKLGAPVKHTVNLDLTTLTLKHDMDMPNQEAPVLLTHVEPVSEELVILPDVTAPVMHFIKTPIYASDTQRIVPVSFTLPVPLLGYEFHALGQVVEGPLFNLPTNPLKGQTYMKVYLNPMDDAPSKVTTMLQWIPAASKKQLPATASVTDPLDLSQPLTMAQMAQRMAKHFSQPSIAALLPSDLAFALTLHASGAHTPRTLQMEWHSQNQQPTEVSRLHHLRLLVSPLPGFSDKPWQFLSEMSTAATPRVIEPEEAFSADFLNKLFKDLDNALNMDSYKELLSLLQGTITSLTQQNSLSAMFTVPTTKVLDSLLPELHYQQSSHNSHDVDIFARVTDIHMKVTEENKKVFDNELTKSDETIKEILQDLVETMNLLMKTYDMLLTKGTNDLTGMALQMNTLMKQSHSLQMMKDIVRHYDLKGLFQNTQEINREIESASQLLMDLLSKAKDVLTNNQLSYSSVDIEGRTVEKMEMPLKTAPEHELGMMGSPVRSFIDFDKATPDELRRALQALTKAQIEIICNIQEQLNNNKVVDPRMLLILLRATNETMTLFDLVDFEDTTTQPIRGYLLLGLIHQEFLVQLWNSELFMESFNHLSASKDIEMNKDINFMIKWSSILIAERMALVHTAHTLNEHLTGPNAQLFSKLMKPLITEEGNYFMEMAYLMKDHDMVKAIVNDVITQISENIDEAESIIKDLTASGRRPHTFELLNVVTVQIRLTNFINMVRFQMMSFPCPENLCPVEEFYKLDRRVRAFTDLLTPAFDKITENIYQTPNSMKLSQNGYEISYRLDALLLDAKKTLTQFKHEDMNTKQAEDIKATLKEVIDRYNFVWESFKELIQVIQPNKDMYEYLVKSFLKEMDNVQLEMITKFDDDIYMPTFIAYKPEFETHLASLKTLSQAVKTEALNMFTSFMEFFSSDSPPEQLQSSPELASQITLKWGDEDTMDKKMSLKVSARRSIEQMLWILTQVDPQIRDYSLVAAMHERLSGMPGSVAREALNTYNHVSIDLDANPANLPAWSLDAAQRLEEMLQVLLWHHHHHHHQPSPSLPSPASGSVRAVLDLSTRDEKFDLAVSSNAKRSLFTSVPLPMNVFNMLKPTQTLLPTMENLINHVSAGFAPATCTLNNDQITTFDTVHYTLPTSVSGCSTLLSMDCSTETDFAVTMQKTQPTRYDLKIATQKKMIEVHVSGMETIVRIDGEKVAESEPFITEDITVVKNNGKVEIHLKTTGILMVVDGTSITTKVSQLFKGRMCGLCSNFDSQRSWELEGPTTELLPTRKAFVSAYTVPNSCPAPVLMSVASNVTTEPTADADITDNNNNNDIDADSDDADTDNDDDKTDFECAEESRTRLKFMRRRNMVCFSDPVSECGLGCDGEKTTFKRSKVTFHCMKQNSKQSRSLLKAIRRHGDVASPDHLASATLRRRRYEVMEGDCQA